MSAVALSRRSERSGPLAAVETKADAEDIDIAIAETERDDATMADMEAAMRQVMAHPANPAAKSENREPTKAELSQRWKLTRR